VTTTLPAHPDPATQTPRGGGAWPALAVGEARRLLCHPATVAATLLVLGIWLVPLAADPASGAYPDLTRSSWTVQYPMLILAAGAFAAANLAGLRPHQHRTTEFERVLSMPRWHRTAAQCAATAAPALLGFAVAAAQLGVRAGRPGAAGTVRWGELLAVPLFIMVAGLLGIVVAGAYPSVAAGFVTLTVLVVVGFVGLASSSRLRWLSFVAGEDPFRTPPMPNHLVDRPEWWHDAWLAGLGSVAVATAVFLAGLRGRVLTVALAVSLVATVAAGAMQLRPPSAERDARLRAAHDAPAAMQVCQTRRDVTYCAFPEFRSRIGAWAAIVEAQLDAVPPDAAVPRFHVRQHLPMPLDDQGTAQPPPLARWAADDAAHHTPNAIPVSTRWSAGGVGSFDETEVLGFSAMVAATVVSGEPPSPDAFAACGARGGLALWLAAGATRDTRGALTTILAHTSGGGLDLPVLDSTAGVRLGVAEVALGRAMLDADPSAVRAGVARHWPQLTSESTSVARAAALLGLPPPGPPPPPGSGTCT